MLNNNAWRNNLNNQTVPKRLPLAQFTNQSMIIGIGDSSSEVFEHILDRMLDTVTVDESNAPVLLHICLKHASNGDIVQPSRLDALEQDRFSSLILDEDNKIPDPISLQQENWRWLSYAQKPTGLKVNDRYGSRVILHKHLQAGPNSPLAYRIRTRIETYRPKTIYIVASAQENAGASLIGDVAALIRAVQPTLQAPIIGIVLMGDEQTMSPYKILTLLELDQCTKPSRIGWQFGGFGFNNRTAPLNTTMAMFGSNLQTMHLLWGMINSASLYDSIYRKSRNLGNQPAVSLVSCYAAVAPIRLLRDLLAYRLLRDFVGKSSSKDPNNGQNFPLNDAAEVNQLLNAYRIFGLSESIEWWYQRLLRQDNRNSLLLYLRNIKDDLSRKNQNLQDRISNLEDKIDKYSMASFGAVKQWLNAPYENNLLDTMRMQVGWSAQSLTLPHPLQLSVARPDDNQLSQDYVIMPKQWSDNIVFTRIEEIARTLVNNSLHGDINLMLQSFHKEELKQNSTQRFNQMRTAIQQRFKVLGSVSYLQLSLNHTPDYSFPDGVHENYQIIDRTFFLQMIISDSVPIWSFIGLPQVSLLKQHLQYTNHRVLFDLFNHKPQEIEWFLKEAPQSVLDLFAYPKALKLFYECWRRGQLQQLQLSPGSVETQIWDFIDRYGRGIPAFDRAVESASTAKLPAKTPNLADDSFQLGLARIFERFRDEQQSLPAYFC